MFRLKHVNRAVVALCAGGAALSVVAQTQQLERVEITGSNIKRVNAETVAPVEVITREQIARTGQATIADVLRNLPANSGGSFGESFGNSFAPGAAGISLRSLGQKTTLVLLNGRRVAGYGFAQNLQDTFVDLNSIPTSAVERVEILKDGASAIYGSDAIAGVVNIILRRDYRGAEITLSGGTSEGKKDYGFTVTGGKGDLGADRFNVFGVFDYYKRDETMLSDTKFGETRDYRGIPGGRNFQSLTGGGTWAPVVPTGSNPNALSTTQRQAIAGCPNPITGAQAVEMGLLAPTSPLATTPGNTFCPFNSNTQISALPGTERMGVLTRGTFEFSPTASAYAELGLSRNKTEQTFTSPFFAGTTGLTASAGSLQPWTYNIQFAPGAAGNPYGTNAIFLGSLIDVGTRRNEITSDSIRGLVGAKFSLGTWDLDSAVGLSNNKVESMNFNRLSLAGTSAVFGVPTTAPAAPGTFPTSTSTTYNLNNPALNSQAVRDQMLVNFPRTSKSELAFVDTKASTELSWAKLPGGNVGLAIGGEFRTEKLKDSPAEIARTGGVLGQGVTATDGKRDNSSIYTELALPLFKSLEMQLAARYDKYSDYGSSTTPKVGVKFTPSDFAAIRANWGKGFRAPTMPEISPSVATFFTTVTDPQDGVTRQISGVFAGNPNLKAETSESTTLGIVLEPVKDFSVSVDTYRINWRNVVASPSFQDIVDASCEAGPPCPSTPQVLRDTGGLVVSVLSNYENLSARKVAGTDIDLRWGIPTAEWGKFNLNFNGAYIHSFKEDGESVVGSNKGANTIPRFKASGALNWDYAGWAITGRVNYVHKYRQELLAASYRNPATVNQTGVYPMYVPRYTTYDLYARYAINKNLSISGAVINLADKTPPYDPGFSTTYNYDFSQYDVRGRQFRLNLNYKI
jgi:iron complex outermembrane recepter protein